MTFVVYILQSQVTSRYYIGQTCDLERRLGEHNSENAGHTKKEQPWQLVWSQNLLSRKEAMALERKIKKRGAKRFLEDIAKGQPG
jgi:putative endonuclease